MSKIEAEVLELSGFVKKAKHERSRQDYLAGLANAMDKMSDDDFEKLSDDATDWVNAALQAIIDKDELPEFPDAEAEEEAETETEETEAEESEEDPDAGEEGGDEGEEPETEPDEESEESEEEPEAEEGGDESKGEPEEKPKPKPVAKAAKPTPKPVAKPVAKTTDKPKAKPVEEAKPKKKHLFKRDPDAPRDRFGLTMGTKVQIAVAMFSSTNGSTMKAVVEKVGSAKRNILVSLAKQGHQVEKYPGGVIRLVHKEDIGKAPKLNPPPIPKKRPGVPLPVKAAKPAPKSEAKPEAKTAAKVVAKKKAK